MLEGISKLQRARNDLLGTMRLVVALTGASGVCYGIRLLQVLNQLGIEIHGIITKPAVTNLKIEQSLTEEHLHKLCTRLYDEMDMGASLASGSFITHGMVVIPCSMHTLSGIAHGLSNNLLLRAADVCLKERRVLVLVPRETPLNLIHLRNMVSAAEAGAIILPAMPAFYHHPRSIQDMIDYVVGKVLDVLGIQHTLFQRWSENQAGRSHSA
jgi:4-hydroxy-3-polyprenylbenzoate decarboxylase